MTDLNTPYVFFFGQAFTVAEVAEKLGISPTQVLNHIADGTLGAINVGRGATRRDLRVTDEALDAFAEARTVAAAQAKVTAKLSRPKNKPAIAGGYAERRAARKQKERQQ
jgi:excisionase family DNA binding protein